MKHPLVTGLIAISMSVLIAGCASPVERANEKNDLLSAAGFHIVPVMTDAQRLQLQTLPPNRVVRAAACMSATKRRGTTTSANSSSNSSSIRNG